MTNFLLNHPSLQKKKMIKTPCNMIITLIERLIKKNNKAKCKQTFWFRRINTCLLLDLELQLRTNTSKKIPNKWFSNQLKANRHQTNIQPRCCKKDRYFLCRFNIKLSWNILEKWLKIKTKWIVLQITETHLSSSLSAKNWLTTCAFNINLWTIKLEKSKNKFSKNWLNYKKSGGLQTPAQKRL